MPDEKSARAYLKGQIRTAQAAGDKIALIRERKSHSYKKTTAKQAKAFFIDELDSYGKFLVSSMNYKKYGSGSSTHWKNEYTSIEPELIQVKNIGSLCRFIVGYFDSKRFCKGNTIGHAKFTSQFYFDEHFLFRCIYRLNEKCIGKIGAIIYPIIEWLITENVPITRLNDKNYFVYRDFVLVAHKLPNSKGIIFKTILETEQFSVEQRIKFSEAYKLLSESSLKSIEVVMTNSAGKVARKIPASSGVSLINSITERTFWVQHILTAQDIRNGQ